MKKQFDFKINVRKVGIYSVLVILAVCIAIFLTNTENSNHYYYNGEPLIMTEIGAEPTICNYIRVKDEPPTMIEDCQILPRKDIDYQYICKYQENNITFENECYYNRPTAQTCEYLVELEGRKYIETCYPTKFLGATPISK